MTSKTFSITKRKG